MLAESRFDGLVVPGTAALFQRVAGRRADPGQTVKEPCTYCQTRFGFDYYIQPAAPKSAYTKKGRFDDELICA